MKFKHYIKICKIWVTVMIILCFTGYFVMPLRALLTVIMVSLIAVGLLSFVIFGKCPSCRKNISLKRLFFISRCKFCGKNLYD